MIGSRDAFVGLEAHDVGDCVAFFTLRPTDDNDVLLEVWHTNLADISSDSSTTEDVLNSLFDEAKSWLPSLLDALVGQPHAVVRLIEGPCTRNNEAVVALLPLIDQRIQNDLPQAGYARLQPLTNAGKLMDVMMTVKGEIVYRLYNE